MNYKLKIEDGISVVEASTNQIIRSFSNMQSARKFLRHLNLGGGFDGWTPTFFLKKIVIPVN